MKRIVYLLSIAMALIVAGCGNDNTKKNNRERTRSAKSSTKELISKNIDKLGESRWNKNSYLEIRDKQIEILNSTQNAKRALRNKLDRVYSEVLVKEGNLLMDNNCGSNHKTLTQVMEELKNFPDAPNSAELNARYSVHQEVLSFVNTINSKQRVRSYKDNYDYSFESKIKNKVATYLKKDIKCAFLKNKLNNTSSAFKTRRSNFCNTVVSLFCQQSSYSRAEDNVLRTKIKKVNGRMEKSWEAKLNNFKEKHTRN